MVMMSSNTAGTNAENRSASDICSSTNGNWICSSCTYEHTGVSEVMFLVCKVCNTPRTSKGKKTKVKGIQTAEQAFLPQGERNDTMNMGNTTLMKRKRKVQHGLNYLWVKKQIPFDNLNNFDNDPGKTTKCRSKAVDRSLRSVNEVLKQKKSEEFCPSPRVKLASGWQDCTESALQTYTPLTIVRNVLPNEMAQGLLKQLMEASASWNQGHWYVIGKMHEALRKTALFSVVKEERSKMPVSEQATSNLSEITNLGENVTSERGRSEYGNILKEPTAEMLSASDILTLLVENLRPKQYWKATYVLINRYDNGNDNVGFHSDHLAELGPRPIIVGLSVGATRRFDLTRVSPDDETTNNIEKLDNYCSGAQIYLPHNSALIMWDDCQEKWKHSIPKCTNSRIFSHKLSGLIRFSLTFRMQRDDMPSLGTCYCGDPVSLKCVNGQYVLICKPYGREKKSVCKFYRRCDWAEQEAQKKRREQVLRERSLER